jgi:hypothetical protein
MFNPPLMRAVKPQQQYFQLSAILLYSDKKIKQAIRFTRIPAYHHIFPHQKPVFFTSIEKYRKSLF